MKITIFGGAGDVGRRVAIEALNRGHTVTAVARSASQLNDMPAAIHRKVADVSEPKSVTELAEGQDLIISALRPKEGSEPLLVPLTRSVLDAARNTSVKVLIVGGAARLLMPDESGHTVLTAPDFLPASVKPIAEASFKQYQLCLAEQNTDWVYLSPPAMLEAGTRTGNYQRGSDHLLINTEGQSKISMEDLAVALLDEAEQPSLTRFGFTVAYS